MNAYNPYDESMFVSPTNTCPCDETLAFATNTCDPCEMASLKNKCIHPTKHTWQFKWFRRKNSTLN